MADHPNAARVREMFAAFRRGDADTVRATLDENVVWRFPGRRGALAGEHRGRDAVFAFLMSVQGLTSGSFHLELEDVIANDERAVAFFRGRAERDGKTLDNPTCLKIRIREGRVVELDEFVWDLGHVEDFWS